MYKQTNLLFVLLILTIYINSIKCSKIFNKKQQQQNTIYLNEKASKNLRLRSVLNVNINDLNSKKLTTQSPILLSTTTPTTVKTNKIYWSFKRLYTLPRFNSTNSQNELSLTESMISLDNEVQENLKDKFIISQTKNSEFDLIINNLTYADSGIYKCNLWNQKTIYYHLIVTSPIQRPEIFVEKFDSSSLNAIDSSSKMILESSNVTLKCVSKYAYPYPSFNWFQNNKQIAAMSVTTHLVDKEMNMIESILHINNIDSSFHMSNFTCKLMQLQFDEIDYSTDNYKDQEQLWQQSETVTLNIAFKPIVNINVNLNNRKNFSSKSSSSSSNRIILYDDSDIDFECKYKSNPVDSIQVIWKLDDAIQYDFTDKNTFKWLKRSNRYDLYKRPLNLTCQVGNSIGFGSFSYEIELIYEPRINLDNRIYEIDEFSQLKINCSVVSSPEAHIIEWRKYETGSPSSILINNIENYKVVSNRSILEFKSIKHNENAGYYVCIAINSMNDSFGQYRLGQKYVKIEVNVRFRPQINMIAKKVAANLTATKHALNCMTMAHPEPSFQWYRNGIKLNTNSSKYLSSNVRTKSKNLFENSLIINDMNMDDLNKVYECEASNQLGANRLEIELVPLSKPEKPSELRTLFVNFMMITLGWSSGFDGGLEQEFFIQLNDSIIDFKNESVLKLDSNIEIIKSGPSLVNFTNLTPDATYSIRIMSKNKLGSSGWTDYINVKTNRINSKDSNLLPIFDSLFFNVPKNRLEFTVKKDSDIDPFIQSLIPICLNVTTSLENQFLKQLHFDQCLNVNNFANINIFSFDSLNDLILDDKITLFEPKKVKSIKVSICFQMNKSICNLMPTTAIIDTYNKISPLNKNANENNGLNHIVASINLSKSFTNKSKTIPLALIIGICVCILSLLVLLFVTVIYCIRKRNIKLCKSLLSHSDAVKSLKNSSSSSSSGNSDSTESSNTNTTSRHSQDCTDLAKVAAMSAIKTEFERKLASQNKTFHNIDISSISAPLAYKTITSSTNDIINSHNILLSNSISGGTITTANKRTFSAALTATANNIIGKHKSINCNNEIMVTEDDEKTYKMNKNNKSPSDTCSNPSSVDESKIIDPTSQPTSSAASTTSSSNTSSTAVSSAHNHNVNSGGYLFTPSEYNSSFQNSNDLTGQYHQNNGITFIDTFNSGIGSSASNTDPIAINNSISSSHSTTNTDSPTYNYNVTSATLNNNHNQDSILYIKSTLNNTSTTNSNSNNLYQVQLDESSNYVKNTIKSKNSIFNNTTAKQLINDQSESGYSTPSRHKKVVYEVIV